MRRKEKVPGLEISFSDAVLERVSGAKNSKL